MHVVAFTRREFGQHLELLTSMFRLRRRVFKDRLDWNVSVSEDFEMDVFDTLDVAYLLVLSDTGSVVGCVRFLPTTGPTMLGHVFATLLQGEKMPCANDIIESSRFCVDTNQVQELADNGLRRASFLLFAGMVEWAQSVNARAIITVTDARMERVLRRAGWSLDRLGMQQRFGDTTALAGYLSASNEALGALYRNGALEAPVLKALPSVNLAA